MAYIVRGLCDVVKYGKQKFNLKINMMRNENMNTLQDSQSCKTRVSKSAFDKLNLNMNKNWSKYLSAKGSLEAYLSDFIDFDFSINDMPGDGFVVLDYQNDKVASVESCFKIILEKGKINQDDFATLSF